MKPTEQAAQTADGGQATDHGALGVAGFTGPDSDGSLATTLALVAAVNLLVLAVLYPLLAATAVLGLAGGFMIARYATRSDRPPRRRQPQSDRSPRPQ